MTGSKFAGFKAMREKREQTEAQQATLPESTPAAPAASPRRVGRPPGKRSDPAYQQVTVLLQAANYLEVRKRLLGEKKEVSSLIDELLDNWLKS